MARIWVSSLSFPKFACSAKRLYGPNLVSSLSFSQVCLLCEEGLWPESGFQA